MTRPVCSCRQRDRAAAVVPEHDDDMAEERKESEYGPAGKKRTRRATKATVSRQRVKRLGKLSPLQETPLEVLFEVCPPTHAVHQRRRSVQVQIFSSLCPYDLLRVLRATKSLRAVLTARSARVTWTQVLATMPDLPPCLDDLTEIAWTRLLLDTVCHVRSPRCCRSCSAITKVQICNASGIRNVCWCLRLSVYSKCIASSEYADFPNPLLLLNLAAQTGWICAPQKQLLR